MHLKLNEIAKILTSKARRLSWKTNKITKILTSKDQAVQAGEVQSASERLKLNKIAKIFTSAARRSSQESRSVKGARAPE